MQDENDNWPIFSQSTVTITLKEDVHIGSLIATFNAIDKDAGLNANLRYNITEGNTHDRFAVDMLSGRVTLRSLIDRDPPNNEKAFKITVMYCMHNM